MRKTIKNKVIRTDSQGTSSIINVTHQDNVETAIVKRKHYRSKKKGQRLSYKKLAKRKRALRARQLHEYADRLERNLPKSEQWFRKKYENIPDTRLFKGDHWSDRFNKPYNEKYIPDVHNLGYKYIIEIDGSIHDLPEVKLKDIRREYYFYKREYIVIRIEAYNDASFDAGMARLKEQIDKINALETERRAK